MRGEAEAPPAGWTAVRRAQEAAWRAPAAAAALDPDAAREAAWAAWLARAHDAQRPPPGDWRTWLLLGGRGAGKTRAGAEWLSAHAGPGARLALVGPTLHEVREVMVEGVSGLRAIAPPAQRPRWETSRRRLVWPSGAEAAAFSAEEPDGLRGPQFHAAWADEFAAWRNAEATLANLRLGLRLGDAPRLAVTTTPRAGAALRRLRAESTLVETRAPTAVNAAHLAPAFLEDLHAVYGGTRLAAQELEGLVADAAGALWTAETLSLARDPFPPAAFDRVVVAVDPPAGGKRGGSACGIVVAGRAEDAGARRAWVLADRTAAGLSPAAWAARVAATAAAFGATEVVAEANQGGDMVAAVLAAAGVPAPVRLVRAASGKRARAEPVAALYEQGRVHHAGAFRELEEELMALGAEDAAAAPSDRADALVWAVTALLLDGREGPRIRRL